MSKRLPTTLYVRIDKENNGNEYPWAFQTLEEAVDGDGPTTIGVYKLAETMRRKKVVAPA